MRATRRRFLQATAGVTAALAGCGRRDEETTHPDRTVGSATEPGTTARPAVPTVGLETVTDRIGAPVSLAAGPDGTRYVVAQPGRMYAISAEGAVEPILDIRDAVVTGGERGLLGLALHPTFASNRRLYLRYSAPPREGTPSRYDHTFVLAEFSMQADGTVDRTSERTLLEIPEPQSNHNSGSLAFGPDGYLYVGVGDGGGANDVGTGHVEDWYDENAGGNGQDVEQNLLGSVLRIDVDDEAGGTPYGIPDDNPLVGTAGLDEHYAWGFRNPWGMSFDDDDLYVADVGQNRYEEVNLVERGGNYGWNVKEATHCFRNQRCPTVGPDGAQLRDPVIEYPHSGGDVNGIAVIGGYVYRGSAIPGLQGRYVFGDLQPKGRLFVGTPPAGGGLWPTQVLEVASRDQAKLQSLLGFGRDRDDDLYALTRGGVHRLVASG